MNGHSVGAHHGHAREHEHAAHEPVRSGDRLLLAGEEARAGQPADLRLLIRRGDGEVIRDYETAHGHKVHLMIIRDALDVFAHVHPEVDDSGGLTAPFTFPTGGTYRLYADYTPAGGGPSLAVAELRVAGEAPPAAPLAPDVPGVARGAGLTALVSVHGAKAGGHTEIAFDLKDEAGGPAADLQELMGAIGHLVVVSQDGADFVHAHPHGKSPGDGRVVFHARFPRPGACKGWGQFRRRGRVADLPFVVKVD
jgi:hypothetical protein